VVTVAAQPKLSLVSSMQPNIILTVFLEFSRHFRFEEYRNDTEKVGGVNLLPLEGWNHNL